MTCGICNPQGFREAWHDSNPVKGQSPRVWGYAVAKNATTIAAQVKALLFHGADHVFADFRTGQIRTRPGFETLTNPVYLRSGDTLLIAHKHAFGKNARSAGCIEENLH